jgi:hypothetical protein
MHSDMRIGLALGLVLAGRQLALGGKFTVAYLTQYRIRDSIGMDRDLSYGPRVSSVSSGLECPGLLYTDYPLFRHQATSKKY